MLRPSDFQELTEEGLETVVFVMLPVGRPDDVADCPLLELVESSKRAFAVR